MTTARRPYDETIEALDGRVYTIHTDHADRCACGATVRAVDDAPVWRGETRHRVSMCHTVDGRTLAYLPMVQL